MNEQTVSDFKNLWGTKKMAEREGFEPGAPFFLLLFASNQAEARLVSMGGKLRHLTLFCAALSRFLYQDRITPL